MSPRKVRQVVDLIRGKDVDESLNDAAVHEACGQGAGREDPALRRGERLQQHTEALSLEPSDLYVKEAFVDEGPTMKRFRPRAMGRATMIRKRTSHITIVVGDEGRQAGRDAEERVGSEGTSGRHEARHQPDLEVQVVRQEELRRAAQGRPDHPEVRGDEALARGHFGRGHRAEGRQGRREREERASRVS